jgi:zinc protease
MTHVMHRRLALAVFATFAIPAFAADEPLPAAAAILDRFIEVTGGKAAYEKQKTIVETGKVEFAALGLKGTLISYAAEPGKSYSELNLDGVGKVTMGISGGVAWENNPIAGPHIKTGEEQLQALRDSRMNSTYHWRELYAKAQTTGSENAEGEDCYKVLMTPAGGNPVTMYFGKKSGLLKKSSLIAVSQQGDIPTELIAAEYREFGGILMPAKVTEKAAGQEFTITIENVKVNQEIPPERFDLPAEIKALQNQTAK